MLSRLREHFGTAGLIVAIVALVAALGGGAIAATGGSGENAEATASAKGKQGPRGPKGPKGAKGAKGDTGPAGPQGPAGPAGAKGDTGAKGADGAAGAKGATGATGATGNAGTAGATGATGATGFSGFTETLPSGETETGSWAAGPLPAGTESVDFVAISFPIPLATTVGIAAPPTVVPVGGPTPPNCAGGTAAEPKAAPGNICVYAGFSSDPNAGLGPVFNPSGPPASTISTTGLVLNYGTEVGAEGAFGWGTYAVTAP